VDHMESESHGDRCKGHSGSKLDAGWGPQGPAPEVTWRTWVRGRGHLLGDGDVDDRRRVRWPHCLAAPGGRDGRPNQVLSIPGVATLILNESRHDPDGTATTTTASTGPAPDPGER